MDSNVVAQALQASMAGADEIRKPAEAALVEYANVGGFLDAILRVFCDPSFDVNLRLASVICLKRTLHIHWKPRKASVYGITDAEKNSLKAFLLSHNEEPVRKLAVQLSVVVADIARRDWPGNWDNLFNSLMNDITTGSDIVISRGVYTLHRVLKELATKRLARDRVAFVEVASQIFPLLHTAYQHRTAQLLESLSSMSSRWETNNGVVELSEEENMKPLADLVTYLVKCMHRVVLSGFPTSLQEDSTGISPQEISVFFQGLLGHEAAVLEYLNKRSQFRINGQVQNNDEKSFSEQLSKVAYRMTLIVVEAQRQSPLPFRAFLSPFLVQFHDQLSLLYKLPPPPENGPTSDHNGPTPWTIPIGLERLAINLLTFLTQVLGSDEYRRDLITLHATSHSLSATGKQEMSAQAVGEASQVLHEFFSPERAKSLLDLAMHSILPLRNADLEEWVDDPETFHLNQVSLTAAESPRAAAERLVVAFLESAITSPQLVELLGQLLQDTTQGNAAGAQVNAMTQGHALPTEVVLWDARYLASGIVATHLRNGGMEFSQWFLSTLAPSLNVLAQSNTSSSAPPVLTRRILWLVGTWMSEVPNEMRPALYSALVDLLGSSTSSLDAAVSLTLLRTLTAAVDSWDFNASDFMSLTGPTVAGLYNMLSAFDELDSRLQVMNLLHLILSNVGPEGIRSCVESILSPLGQIWQSAEGAEVCLLRKRVLNILNLVVIAIGCENTSRLDPLVMPMLIIATNPQVAASDYVMEDGLELWTTIMNNTTIYSADLHGLFPHLHPILTRDLEFLQVSMKLVESYVVLGAGPFLQDHAPVVSELFHLTVTEVSPRGAQHVAAAIETLLRRFPEEAADMLRQSGVLTKLLLTVVESNGDDRLRNGGDGYAPPSRNDDTIVVHYLSLLARVLFTAPTQMRALLHVPGITDGSPEQVMARMLQLVDLWLQHFDAMGFASSSMPWRRKLVALALVSLIPADPRFLERLDQILSVCIDVMAEPLLGPEGTPDAKTTPNTESSDLFSANLIAMQQADPVSTTDLKAYLSQKMGEASGSFPNEFQASMAAIDPILLQQLQ